MDIAGHFTTITKHKLEVMKNCFAAGLYLQGLLHDLSKYTPAEFIPGAVYYQGNRSPNNAEREKEGVSKAWLHHKGRNKHHYEYWTDYDPKGKKGMLVGAPMPRRYIAEMFCDRVAASKIYNGDRYSDAYPLAYLMQGIDSVLMHERTKNELVFLLDMLKIRGEKYTFWYIKNRYLKGRSVPKMDIDRIKKNNPIPDEMSK